jgi:hypothetical protein
MQYSWLFLGNKKTGISNDTGSSIDKISNQ